MGGHAEEAAVAIAQEAEVVAEGVIVYALPVVADGCRHEEEERALRLVEIGEQGVDDPETVAGKDDNGRGSLEVIALRFVEPTQQGVHGFAEGAGIGEFIRLPLAHSGKVLAAEEAFDPHPVKAFQRADGGGTDGYHIAGFVAKGFDQAAGNHHALGVHVVPADGLGLDRAESARADVESEFLDAHAFCPECFEQRAREMQSGGRCRHRAFLAGIDGLVTDFVGCFRFAVEVRGNRDAPASLQDFAEGKGIVPHEAHKCFATGYFLFFGSQDIFFAVLGKGAGDCAFFPFLQVADHATPDTGATGSEIQGVIHGSDRLQAEDLNDRAGGLAKENAGMDDLGVVENQGLPGLQEVLHFKEATLGDLPVRVA